MWDWIKSIFAWENIWFSGVWLYQENRLTKERRAIKKFNLHQPVDKRWLMNLRPKKNDRPPPDRGFGCYSHLPTTPPLDAAHSGDEPKPMKRGQQG